jgi:hypothetical protein
MNRSHTHPSTEDGEWTESERVTALLRQIEDLRHSNRRLVYANLELDQLMRTHAEQVLAKTAWYEAESKRLQGELQWWREHCEHHQAEAQAVWAENQALLVRLSALRYQVADRVAHFLKRVPGLERVLRLIFP